MPLASTNRLHLKSFLEGRLTLKMISELPSVTKNLYEGYQTGVFFERFKGLEGLSQGEKVEYWEQARELRPDLKRDELTRLCKAFYYLSYLANQEL